MELQGIINILFQTEYYIFKTHMRRELILIIYWLVNV